MIFWKSNKTRPIPNSIAEKTKKKNVKDNIFKLSKIKPTNKTIAYKEIHKISAVKSKWRAVLVFMKTLNKIKKKKINKRFKLSTVILKLKTMTRFYNIFSFMAKSQMVS